MPFSQLDKIDATIRFEAESIMAVPLDGMIVDFALLEQRPDGSTVLVTCVQEDLLNEYIDALQAADIIPDTIDIDSLALARLMEELKEARTIALLDCGAEKASVGIFQKGGLRFTRSIPLENGAKASLKKMRPALDELILSMHVYQGAQKGAIDEIWLVGGNARLKGVADYLQKGIGGTITFPDFMRKIPSSITISDDMNLVGGVALGLALRGLRKEKGRVDLARKTSRSIQTLAPALRKRALHMAAAVIFLVVLIAANFFLGVSAKERRYAVVKRELRRVYQETFPEAKGAVTNELQQAQALVKAMGERGVKIPSDRGNTFLDIMREITQLLPAETKIMELDIDEKQVSLRGIASTFAVTDEVKKALSASELFSEVKTGTAELAQRGQQGVTFQMFLVLKQ
jgi:hypothetical protein